MKKFTLIVAALFVAASLFAQDAQWGVKGGLNIASEVAGERSTDSRVGIHLGGFMEKAISTGLDFQVEFLYSMQGATYRYGGTDHIDKLDYLNVPVMIKIYLNQNRRFSIDVGTQLGFLVSAKVTAGNSTTNVYNNDKMQKLDVSLGIGLSYKLNDNLDLVFRGNQGLTPIVDGLDHKNSVVQLGVGYRF